MCGRCDWLILMLLLTGLNVSAQRAGELKLEPYVFEGVNKEKADAAAIYATAPKATEQVRSR
jgi:hypothetical protein